MTRGFKLLSFLIIFLISSSAYAGEVLKDTHIFSIKGSDTLRLDRYYLPDMKEDKPCVIFAFGGGFFAGVRNGANYLKYFDQLAKSGYNVVSIDYRLGLKDLNMEEIKSPIEVIALLKRTINNTVEDLLDATTYILAHSLEWHINKEQIITSGSSSGAITVLQAEYELANGTKLSEKLPSDFRYAGVISFAGALLSMDGDLKWERNPAPMQFFHGNADGNVPYDKLEFFNIGLYGSKHIVENIEKLGVSYYFYDVDNADHAIAVDPIKDNINEVKTFIEKQVLGKSRLSVHNTVQAIGETPKKKDFTILNYLINNFAP